MLRNSFCLLQHKFGAQWWKRHRRLQQDHYKHTTVAYTKIHLSGGRLKSSFKFLGNIFKFCRQNSKLQYNFPLCIYNKTIIYSIKVNSSYSLWILDWLQWIRSKWFSCHDLFWVNYQTFTLSKIKCVKRNVRRLSLIIERLQTSITIIIVKWTFILLFHADRIWWRGICNTTHSAPFVHATEKYGESIIGYVMFVICNHTFINVIVIKYFTHNE